MEKRLTGKTIVITGASSGVGRAMALACAREGASLMLCARREPALQQLVEDCKELGGNAYYFAADVTDAAAMKTLAAQAFEQFSRIDVWVNNAGVLAAGAFDETPVEVHDRVIQTNLMGYLHGAHAVLPYFKRQQKGILINNISVGAWFPTPYATGYSASKFGLQGFGEALQGELYQWPHIHVCNLYPAFLDTPGMQHAANYTGKALRPAPPVYDPLKVGKAVVELACHPEPSRTVGAMASILHLAHALAPGLAIRLTANVMNSYFRKAKKMPSSNGNLFESVEYGSSIYGGWTQPELKKKLIRNALLAAGIIAGIALLNRRSQA